MLLLTFFGTCSYCLEMFAREGVCVSVIEERSFLLGLALFVRLCWQVFVEYSVIFSAYESKQKQNTLYEHCKHDILYNVNVF